ncbi:hypothetical protein EJ05DRAFT_484823 [Pseudovirgaria hyperparasitica]|uniref:Zn(2)-C6 fungal-type domain-containing protein n=1 Tax=Pseudovirgaria hyperparasitica TaxID=470096 RepID=A0A6A6WFP0_9PEZI|nr:uncharacterized protein EJ05DRAFT_484823 [Pseudovirgaria hyperparasitica]KAF2759941.1 hypothetical protein EJ05DRAFT_484823 [Pseudovirgaria hyperparasitica]
MDMDTNGASPSQSQPPLSLQETPRADVDDILRRKRKAREYKACYPCRQRKVKCDQNVPCKTCIVREHPELCTYHPPTETHPPAKRAQIHPPSSGVELPNGIIDYAAGTVTLSREDWDRICAKLITMENSMSELRGSIKNLGDRTPPSQSQAIQHPAQQAMMTGENGSSNGDLELSHIRTQGIHTTNSLTGETVHVGGGSVPALIMALGRGDLEVPGVQELLGKKSILPLFGLDNESATYPFVDLWGLPHGSIMKATEISGAIPNDQDCLSLFRYHRETAHIIYPALVEIDKFEADLMLFLINRANTQQGDVNDGITEQSIYGKNLHWIGLFFAALASGCQCSSMPRKERDLTSQVYVCCSFECLRFTNFLSQPTMETIQTLLILGNVISNNMNAGVAWSLMGLTVRLSQSIGLHRRCPDTTPAEVMKVRCRLWWMTLWQDTHLSISYDRLAASAMTDGYPFPSDDISSPGHRSYAESMYRLVKCGLSILEDRSKPQDSDRALQRITDHRNELQSVVLQAADFLRDSRRCRSMRDQLEHWALYLYMSYVTSELCRPALNPSNARLDLSKTLRKTCVDALTNTVEAFLGLQNMTAFASRSWVAVHRALSSSLLLTVIGETQRNERAKALISNLVTILGEIISKVDPVEMSAPITRSIAALRRLVNLPEGPIVPVPESSNTGSPVMVHNLENIQNLLNFDDPTYGSDNSLAGLDADQSPYALVDSIIWGGNGKQAGHPPV